jgi:hypothetical protein
LLFGIFLVASTQFLHTYQKKNTIHLWLNAVFFFELYPQFQPPDLHIFLYLLHAANIRVAVRSAILAARKKPNVL